MLGQCADGLGMAVTLLRPDWLVRCACRRSVAIVISASLTML